MALPVLALFPWLVGLFASTIGAIFTFFATFIAARIAVKVAVVTAYLVAVAVITAATAVAVKAIIMGAQVAMPSSLGAATYFLPHNINIIMGAYFAMRVSFYLYRWTSDRMTAYVRLAGTAF